ncbi:hypothetical protein B0O80DRAFT_417525 [Mortierella sp. GBAus27b]|nr:hypothetical protein B0O80DRAFT_417525 [Mortierella sp. GBAus27b]
MASTAPQQLQTPPQSKPKKASFIRGRAGFAWLEKRLPQASMGMDDEILNNESWNYHDEGKLLDEMEIELAKGYVDRITDQHYLMKDVMGGNYHVPMDLTFKRVLENGCGAGDWTLDMASELPEADFVAIPQIMYTNPDADMSGATPSRPRGLLGADQSQQQGTDPGSSAATSKRAVATVRPSIRPRNCDFYPDVPINSLPYPDDSFDFVYQRRQCVVLLAKEWRPTVSELYRVLKPGGWVQILEPDLFLRGGGDLCQFAGRYTVGMFEGTGRSPNVIHELKPLLESAGFVNVEVKIFSIPLGWGGVIGQAMLVNQKQFVNEMEPIYVRQGHGTSAEYQGLIKTIFDEAVEKKAYINYHVVVGQKLDTSTPSFPEGFKMTMCETRKCDTSTPSLPEGFKMTMCETRKCDTSTPSLPEGFKMTMCETRKCDIIDTSNRIGDDSQVVVTLDGMTSKPQSEPTVVAADSSSPSSSSTPSSPRA